MRIFLSLFLVYFSLGNVLMSQKEAIEIADYERAVKYLWSNYNNKTAFNLFTRTNWFEDQTGLWFLDHAPEGKTFKQLALPEYQVKALFDHKALAASLSQLTGDTLSASQLPLSQIDEIGQDSFQFSYKSKTYGLDIKTNQIFEIKKEAKKEATFESISPDGEWIAFTKEYNLYVKSATTNEEHQLSFDGEKDYVYGSWYDWFDKMHGEHGERPQRFFVSWSDDSKYLASNICDTRNAAKMYLLDWSQDSLYRPALMSYYRGSPGDTNMVYMQPVFYELASKKEIKTSLPKHTHINAVNTRWSKTPGIVYAYYAERGYQKEYVLRLDLVKNTSEVLIEETSKTNLDNFSYRIVEALEKILFLSERSGWRQLYAIDLKTKETKALCSGNYYVHEIKYLDQENGFIYFTASGKEKGVNPYYQQVYQTDLEGNLKLLTKENAHHVVSFSPDGKHFTDNYSTLKMPTKAVLRTANTGKIVSLLAEASLDKKHFENWSGPESFHLLGKDGKTTIYGAIWKPTNFDPTKKYPIIDHSYTGPHTQVVPKSFDRVFTNQALAELGFVVMMVDGLGTAGRSKAFHDHSYKNMGNNLEDHVLAIKHLGKRHSWIDTNRVGIFGHSAGGFDAGHALLAFPEFYKVGVASSADHDFRMEKAWWPEMYMGWPVDETYHEVSNITMASNLKGKLLLVHGALDDNVNPSATFKLAEALVKADKDFDLLIFPSQRHGYRGKFRNYFMKKRWNYFVEHLGEKTPIWNFKWE